jgi:Trk-type K+ transport system membrane component
MPMWAFLLIIVGGLIVFGIIYDQINKRKKKKTPKNLSSSQMVYTENYLNEVRNDINGPQ